MTDPKTPDRFTEDKPIEALAPTVVESMTKAEIDVAIATAHRFPRSLTEFRKRALSLATIDEDVAESCYFKVRRGKNRDGTDKFIEGPSVRLAEIVASTYGNVRVAARVTEINQREVVAQGVAIDLESNYSTSVEVRMSIVGKYGRYSDDMINMTANACCSKARRNALWGTIPFAVVKPIYEEAKRVAVGDANTLQTRRDKTLELIEKAGISRDRVFGALSIGGADDIGIEELETLKGLWTAVKDGEASADEAFPKTAGAAGNRFSKDEKKGEEKRAEAKP